MLGVGGRACGGAGPALTCISISGSVANHCTNWKMASLYITNEIALLTEVLADESSVSFVVDGAAYTGAGLSMSGWSSVLGSP